MARAWTILTAMPPTVGHDALVEFTQQFGEFGFADIVLCTQPGEPLVKERQQYLMGRKRTVHFYTDTIEQDPYTPGFRDMWKNIMADFGFEKGDYLVTSETYGKWLAEMLQGVWIPFDIDRHLVPSKATSVRHDYIGNWNDIAPDFRALYLTKRITSFGAESCGKTTFAQYWGDLRGHKYVPEWARTYLEAVGPEVTVEKMLHIAVGQRGVQQINYDVPFVFHDTDLFSTLGYWRMFSPDTVPAWLPVMAKALASDLYVVCPSDIPFESDQLRYGGDKRESTDQYWINLLEEFNLNYIVLDRSQGMQDFSKAMIAIRPVVDYDRKGF